MTRRGNRRQFLQQSALAGVGFWVGTGLSLAQDTKSANEKLNVAVVGCGGQGGGNLGAMGGENIVALCDVDEERAKGAFSKYADVKKYADYRKMLEEMDKQIDAVVVSTPDHMHAPISLMAMKMKKHVYCEKPLTWSVQEARLMRETAAKMKVATQMGNQGTSGGGFRQNVEVIQSGALGPVKEVHVWSNRPIWAQGMTERPPAQEVPATLKWDLWLGVAQERPYNKAYLPFSWRGWWDYGTGALGDMACHTANLPFMALKLGYPTAIEADTSGLSPESPPKWSIIRFDFPARGELPPVKFTWYDGGKKPSDDVLKEVAKVVKEGKIPGSGCLIVGEKGQLFTSNDYGQDRKLLPEDNYKDHKPPEPTLPRSPGHHREWILACKGGKPAMSNFDYAAFLTETILLGNVAMRVGKRIDWDGPNMKSPNCPEAEKFVKREYRRGWTV
jgi:predicted dehydrogenase